MPYKDTPWLKEGRLRLAEGGHVVVDTPEWFAWLKTATKFCYTPSWIYRVTARREKRHSKWYWYAYMKKDSKLHTSYLGQTEQLTAVRLK